MWNVCFRCGVYTDEKEVISAEAEPAGYRAVAKCPHCGAGYPFFRLPLFVVTGASGTGKTALALWSAARHIGCVHIESDILWGLASAFPDDPQRDYRGYRNMWLRVCKNINQAGRPVVLYGSAVPEQWENCPERRYLGEIHTLALVCAPDTLAARLRARPHWRQAGSNEFIDNMQRFNSWFLENADRLTPPVTRLDTTRVSIEETGAALLHWIAERWDGDKQPFPPLTS